MSILDLVGNAASGGILGVVGSVFTGVVSLFQAKNQFAHDEAMADLEIKRIAANSEAQKQLSADQLKIVTEQGAVTAFQSSQVAASSINNVPPIIAGLLSLWRPVLTALLLGLTYYFYFSEQGATRDSIAEAICNLAGLSVAWWFGSRQMQHLAPAKHSSVQPEDKS